MKIIKIIFLFVKLDEHPVPFVWVSPPETPAVFGGCLLPFVLKGFWNWEKSRTAAANSPQMLFLRFHLLCCLAAWMHSFAVADIIFAGSIIPINVLAIFQEMILIGSVRHSMNAILRACNDRSQSNRIEVFLRTPTSQSLEDDVEPASFSYELFKNASDGSLEAAVVYIEVPLLDAGIYDLKVNLVLDGELVATRVIFTRYIALCSLNLAHEDEDAQCMQDVVRRLHSDREVKLRIFINVKAKHHLERFNWFVSVEGFEDVSFFRKRHLQESFVQQTFFIPNESDCVEFLLSSDKFHRISHNNAAVPEYVEFAFDVNRLLPSKERSEDSLFRLRLYAQSKTIRLAAEGTRLFTAGTSQPFCFVDDEAALLRVAKNSVVVDAEISRLFDASAQSLHVSCADGDFQMFTPFPVVQYAPHFVPGAHAAAAATAKINFIMALPAVQNKHGESGALFGAITNDRGEIVHVFHFFAHRSTQHPDLAFVVEAVVLQVGHGATFGVSYVFVHPEHVRRLSRVSFKKALCWSTLHRFIKKAAKCDTRDIVAFEGGTSASAFDGVTSTFIESVFESLYGDKTKLQLLLLRLKTKNLKAPLLSMRDTKIIVGASRSVSSIVYAGNIFLTNLKLLKSDFFEHVNHMNVFRIFVDNLIDSISTDFTFETLEVVADVRRIFQPNFAPNSDDASSETLVVRFDRAAFENNFDDENDRSAFNKRQPREKRTTGTFNGQRSIFLKLGIFRINDPKNEDCVAALDSLSFAYTFNFCDAAGVVINSVKTVEFFIFSVKGFDAYGNSKGAKGKLATEVLRSAATFSASFPTKEKDSQIVSQTAVTLQLHAAFSTEAEFEERALIYNAYLTSRINDNKKR